MNSISKRTSDRRLLKLANLLMADAKKKKGIRFDLRCWAMSYRKAWDRNKIPLDCNTQACAIGLACLSGVFKRQGFSYTIEGNGDALIPTFKGYSHNRHFRAVEEFFGLDYSEARFLFSETYYAKSRGAKAEKIVAKRIRSFVKDRSIALIAVENRWKIG